MLRPLDPIADREPVAKLFARAADYVLLDTGAPPDSPSVDDFFHSAPPGCDPAAGVRLGLWSGDRLDGIAELALGFLSAGSAFIGLLLLAPEVRGRGIGHEAVDALAEIARDHGALALYAAVLDDNPRGMAFWHREGFRIVLTVEDVVRGQRRHRIHRMERRL